jgi:hypothetical protein
MPSMMRLGFDTFGLPATRKWTAVFVLLAFFFQSLAIQTHVHPQFPLTVAKTADQGTIPAKGPLKNQDPMDQCRLCQELAHAGNFVAPSAVVAFVSLNFVPAILLPPASPRTTSAKAFTWQSRAPPVR